MSAPGAGSSAVRINCGLYPIQLYMGLRGYGAGKRAIVSSLVEICIGLRFVCSVKERADESSSAPFVEFYATAELDVKSLSLRLLCLGRPLASLFWLESFQFWSKAL